MFFILLMLFIGDAFLFQIALGYFQVRHLSQVFVQMRRKGKVAIGRKSGRFRSGTIVFLAVDRGGKILDAKRMQGVTIMARFRSLKELIGEDIKAVNTSKMDRYNRLLRLAIEDAVQNYSMVSQGGTLSEHTATPAGTAWVAVKSLFTRKRRSNNWKG